MYRSIVSLMIALVTIGSVGSQDAEKPLYTRFIGPQTMGFIHYRAAELLEIPALQALIASVPGGKAQMATEVQKGLGLNIEDIESVTMYMDHLEFKDGQPQEPRAPYILLTAKRALDYTVVRRPLGPDVQTMQYGKYELMVGKTQAIARIDDRSAMFLMDVKLVEAFKNGFVHPFAKADAGAETPEEWKKVVAVATASKHPFFMGLQVSTELGKFAEESLKQAPPVAAPFKGLAKLQSGYLAMNYVANQERDCQFKLVMHYPDAKAAQAGLGAVKFGIATGKMALNSLPKVEAPRNLDNFWLYAGGYAKKQIEFIKPEQLENTVVVDYPMNSKEFLPVLTLAVEKVRYAADKMVSASNMRQLMIAMHNYHNDFNRMPEVMTLKNGKPLHSWRVQLLPYLEQDHLYKQLKLDEPWDSEHNKKIFESNPMPKVFEHPAKRDGASKKTYYQVFYSKEDTKSSAGFRLGTKLTLGQLAAEDGSSNTIAMAEHGKPVLWYQPEDIEFTADAAFPKLISIWGNDKVQVAFFDGSIRTLLLGKDEAACKSLVTWKGGERIDVSAVLD